MPIDSLGRLTMRRRSAPPPSRPWTPDEDEKVREIAEIGLANDFWRTALPGRTVGEICDRRLTLGVITAPAL